MSGLEILIFLVRFKSLKSFLNFFFKRLEDIAKRKRKRQQVQKALERTLKEDADDVWVFHTRQQSNQGTMEFINLAFEPGKPEDN